jgi:hypothetical protein
MPILCCYILQLFEHVWELFQILDKRQCFVTILNTLQVSDYKCEDSIGNVKLPFLRELRTDSYAGDGVCPYLETPNTISGLAAQGGFVCMCVWLDVGLFVYAFNSIWVTV